MKLINNTFSHTGLVTILIWILSAVAPTCLYAQQPSDNIHLGFIYPFSSHGKQAAEFSNFFSFHVLSGVSRAEEAFSLSGISNVVKEEVRGFQFAGISNTVGHSVEGFQFAGIMNRAASAKGFQFAGVTNAVENHVQAFQFAGIMNRAVSIKGFQFAGISNVVGQSAEGFQFAGIHNRNNSFEGFQGSGLVNVVKERTKGFQVAGLMNRTGDVNGFQFAGLVNRARNVRGVQLAGLVNIADSSDHSLALINIIKNGEMGIGLSIDETQTALLSFRSGGRVFYGILSVGANLDVDTSHLAIGGGFGVRMPLSNSVRVNAELSSVYLEDFKSGGYYKSSLSLQPAIKLSRRLEIFGGPSVNFSETNTEYGKKLVKKDMWHKTTGEREYQLFMGYSAGIQYLLK